jgi:transposase
MVSVLLFALLRRIRSSRQIEYQVRHSIDFMWLVSGRTIDHDTISRFRRAHTAELKDIYRQMIRVAIDLKIAKLGELCIDGTRVLANASRHQTWTAERVLKAMATLDQQITAALSELEAHDEVDELLDHELADDQLPPEIADLKSRRKQLTAVLEQLQSMDEQRRKDGKDPVQNPAQLPKADVDARMLPNKEGGYAPNYTPMAVTETESGFIVGADVLMGNGEHNALLPMVQEISATFDVKVETVMGDTAYSAGENLSGAEAMGIELLAPVADVPCPSNPAHREDPTQPVPAELQDKLPKNPTTKMYDKSAFVYDEQRDCYYCPAGQPLHRKGVEKKHRSHGQIRLEVVYMCHECDGCSQASRCRKDPEAAKGRRITHDAHEPARRRQRERMNQPEVKERFKTRMTTAERPFAILKAQIGLRRFLLRGHSGVRIEWLWGCTAYNFRRLMSILAGMRAENHLQPLAASN